MDMSSIFAGARWRLLVVVAFLVATQQIVLQARAPKLVWPSNQRPGFLAAEVVDFDNKERPLVPTLLLIAGSYRIPMGIEQVTSEALTLRVSIRLAHGTVSDLLDVSTTQLPGYAWTLQDGAVVVHGAKEWTAPTNIFKLKVAQFDVVDSTLNDANNRLRDIVFAGSTTRVVGAPSRPVGIGGDSPGIGALEHKRVTIAMKNTTVRAILDRIVVLSPSVGQQVVWVANAPPNELDQVPGAGLWRLVPVGTPLPSQP